MLELKYANDNDYKWILDTTYKDEAIGEIFEGRKDRIISSFACFIIYVNHKKIGFINLVDEGVEGYAFVDSGILKKYRGNGYGKLSMQKLLEITKNQDFILIGETKKENTPAIQSLLDNNARILDETESEYFFVIEYDKFSKLSGLKQNDILNYIDNKRER